MVHRRNSSTKRRSSSSKKISHRNKRTKPIVATPMIKQEHLDDETRLAKRHLTKEMWQLVSIAVKRMADELVSISATQPAVTRTGSQDQQTVLNEMILPQSTLVNTGAGDELFLKDKLVTINEPVKRRTSPLEILEPSSQTKRKGSSNNATRRTVKPKMRNKCSKNKGQLTSQRSHSKSK